MSDKFEIIPRPSAPPAEWKNIDPDLVTKGNPNRVYFVLVPAFLFTLAFSAALFGWFVSILIIGAMLLLMVTTFGRQHVADKYGLYATWIHETVVPSDEKLELIVKLVDDSNNTIYKAKVIDGEGNEEIYDIKTISPNNNLAASLAESVKDAKVYRDPVNQQCVVAHVGQITVWLWEYAPY